MKTQRIKITKQNRHHALQQACGIINEGGLVAFPTETVYGIAVRADLPDSFKRLADLKHRPDTKPFTLHIGDKKRLAQFVPTINPLNQPLIKRAWPGPLTIVFELNPQDLAHVREQLPAHILQRLYLNNTIGVRLPDHDVARDLLNSIDGPIVAPSANFAGEKPPQSADEVAQALDGHIDMILDAGETRYAQASTVIKLTRGEMQVLRVGVFDEAALRRMRKVSILFVCTGNTCRSPMAWGIARDALAKRFSCKPNEIKEFGYSVSSAGTMAYPDAPATEEAIIACSDLGIDISGHRARPISPEVINRADFIFTMTHSHARAVQDIAPRSNPQTLIDKEDICDPIGHPLEVYQECAQQIQQAIHQRFSEIFPK